MGASILGTGLTDIQPAQFGRLVERLLWHLGFTDVSNIDGGGDGGADIVAMYGSERWVFQVKSKKTSLVGDSAVDELLNGMQIFHAHSGRVVSNRGFTRSARSRVQALNQATGVNLQLWGPSELVELFQDDGCQTRFSIPNLRAYQIDAFQSARSDLDSRGSAFLVLATGLGKTVIAGEIVDWCLGRNPGASVLVLADKRDLVDQLERAMWRHLPKDVPTQQIKGSEKPQELSGVTVATIQSAIDYIRQGYRPSLIFVDEAHHAGADTQLGEALEICTGVPRFGATATPWRGDKFDVSTFFGDPSFKIGIEEGMRLGYLAEVDYRVYLDNVDWNAVQDLSRNDYTIGNLNRHLFLPQRDEEIRDELLDVWMRTPNPRGIVFCGSIEHSEILLSLLRGVPAWSAAAAMHDGISKRDQKTNLAKFRLGDIPLLVAVDILNEGVDVPDVNIVCFARVTHSRRIFVQQLGRGLRLSPGKERVTVLDFVSDLRRTKAILDLKASVIGDPETVILPASNSISFTNSQVESILDEWLKDVADLDTAADEVRLNFPPMLAP